MFAVLNGHVDANTALYSTDHKYGWKTTTTIRKWIETSKFGQRYCYQTLNPSTQKWNKIQHGTYYPIVVLYKDNNGKVCYDWLDLNATTDQVNMFIGRFDPTDFNTAYRIETLEQMKHYRQLMMERFAACVG